MAELEPNADPAAIAAALETLGTDGGVFVLIIAQRSGLVTCLSSCPPKLAADLIETARQRLESGVQ
jgi:hypothetical protein